MTNVRLELLSSLPTAEWGEVRSRLAEIQLAPEQMAFGGVPAKFVDQQSEPGREVFLVCADGALVGVGSLITGALPVDEWPLQTEAVQLRGVVIGMDHQGKGIGTEVSRQLKRLAAELVPNAEHLTLTVNQRNPGARRTYEKAGFKALPEPYTGGPLGPQDIMYVELDESPIMGDATKG